MKFIRNSLLILALICWGNAQADIVHLDDVIITFSLCVGNDCVNGESFGFDTIRLKENNLRIKFLDTSSTASFPSNDWQITANDSSNGGANKFSIDDVTGGRTPMTIEAGAPSHSLYVDDGGRLGLGTSTPVVDVHVKSGNTPTLRLEQDGSSGFTPQTWDVAGNEANFFVRDATNGSTLPLKIFPGAPSNALTIEATTGDIGVGTTAPSADIHIRKTGSGASNHAELDFEANGQKWRFRANSVNGQFNIINDNTSTAPFKIDDAANNNLVQLGVNAADQVDITGSLFINGVDNSTPDYVFEPDFNLESIEEHAEFMWTNKHLPDVRPARVNENGETMFEVGARSQGVLKELEKAHIYIEQLNNKIAQLSQDKQELQNSLLNIQNSFEERLAQLESSR